MGIGYSLVCEKCGKHINLFVGCGMMYYNVLHEKTEAAKRGEYGARLAELFLRYPDGIIDAMNNIYYCGDCRAVKCESSLDFYRLKDSETDGEEELFGPDLDKYILVEKYGHHCDICGKPMSEVARITSDTPVECPECGSVMEKINMLMWD